LYPNHYQESSRPNKRNMFLQVEWEVNLQ
jgi:hypothetical protein